ncbi:dCTP deaminase [Serratia ficaria]|uniref:dCTP deaminase n=1 Tax=Serratia ficaria TaxID=61651 RepID=UPI001E116314|nr:hypothetical protein [Serratia ficaria]NLU17480.1 deoxycytidine deaminase [Serratia liquefaciens]
MILTGLEIRRRRDMGEIIIEPYDDAQRNPNSFNYRLGERLKIPNDDESGFIEITIPDEGYKIYPHTLYLGHTYEKLGSLNCAMSLIGRSSVGRLGLFLQVSANLGHTGSAHCWTLEIVSTKPFILYPKMKIGQISFWENKGDISPYETGYTQYSTPQESKISRGNP